MSLPAAAVAGSLSRMARSTRPQGERRAISTSSQVTATNAAMINRYPLLPRPKGFSMPGIPRVPLLSQPSLTKNRRMISAMPMVAMAR